MYVRVCVRERLALQCLDNVMERMPNLNRALESSFVDQVKSICTCDVYVCVCVYVSLALQCLDNVTDRTSEPAPLEQRALESNSVDQVKRT